MNNVGMTNYTRILGGGDDDVVVGDRRQVSEAVTMIDKSKRRESVLNG